MKKIILALACGAGILSNKSFAQNINVVKTAVPYLLIAPDARAGGMGDQGVATLPDANSIQWNTAKLAFADKQSALSLSYSPWLEELVSDVNITTLAGYYKLNNTSAVTLNVRYFSLGDVTFKNSVDDIGRQFSPNEFNVTAGYSLKLSRRLSAGVNFKFIRSQLSDNQTNGDVDSKPGQTVAADISTFYKSAAFDFSGKDAFVTAGLSISNIGGKIKYSEAEPGSFLPTNMRLGAGLFMDIDNYNSLGFTFETMKLLVPTTPTRDIDGNITSGKDPDVGTISGIFQSFTDSPDGENELQEFTLSFGAEYWYNKQFAFRGGYFYEDEIKGNRNYATVGAGLKLEMASIDVSYLIPTTSNVLNPLKGTIRFSISAGLDAFSSNVEEEEAPKDKGRLKEKSKEDSKKDSKEKGDKKKEDKKPE